MNKAAHGLASEPAGLQVRPWRSGWLGSMSLGLALAFIYLVNGRDMGTFDTLSTALLPLSILRGDGIYFDNGRLGAWDPTRPLPAYLTISHGRVMTLYPIAPALVAVPLVAPQVALLDFSHPG